MKRAFDRLRTLANATALLLTLNTVACTQNLPAQSNGASSEGSSSAPLGKQVRDDNLGALAVRAKLESLADTKLKALEEESDRLANTKAPIEQQLKVLKKLAALTFEFKGQDQSNLVEAKELTLLNSTSADPKDRTRFLLKQLLSSPAKGAVAQEQLFQKLRSLLDSAGTDNPCLRIVILTSWISYYPSLGGIRNQLIEALDKCTETDQESLRIKLNGYLWASGYAHSEHVFYQPPTSSALLKKAYGLAVQLKDPFEMLNIIRLASADAAPETTIEPTNDPKFAERINGREQVLIALSTLSNSLDLVGSKYLSVSNLARKTISEYTTYAQPKDSKIVINSWLQLLRKIEPNPTGYPEDSEFESAEAQIMLGAVDAELGNLDDATKEFLDARTLASRIQSIARQPIDLRHWHDTALTTVDAMFDADLNSDPYALYWNPLHHLNLGYVAQHPSAPIAELLKAAINLNMTSTNCLAALALKQKNTRKAEDYCSELSELITSNRGPKEPPLQLVVINAMVGERLNSEGKTAEAASYYEKFWSAYDKLPKPTPERLERMWYRRESLVPVWPPRIWSAAPQSGPQGGVVQKLFPTTVELLTNYAELLRQNPQLAGSRERLALVEKEMSQEKERSRLLDLRRQVYIQDIKENNPPNTPNTDPQLAIRELRQVIDVLGMFGGVVLHRLVMSLCALGNALISQGEIRYAQEPLAEADRLAEKLPEVDRSFHAATLFYRGKMMLEIGDYDAATKLVSQSIDIMNSDKNASYIAQDYKLVLAQCMLKKGDLNGAQATLSEALQQSKAAYFQVQPEKEAAIKSLQGKIFLAMNKPEQAREPIKSASAFWQRGAPEVSISDEEKIEDDLLNADLSFSLNQLERTEKHVKAAESLCRQKTPNNVRLGILILQSRARLATSQKAWTDARTDYQTAMRLLRLYYRGDCPRIKELKDLQDKLPAA